jgi:hypothetical protein
MSDVTPLKFDNEDNLLRVFRLPLYVQAGFCYNGGHDTPFKMVDWFRPANAVGEPLDVESLRAFIRNKNYYNPNFNYIVMCRTGECFLVDPPPQQPANPFLDSVTQKPAQ